MYATKRQGYDCTLAEDRFVRTGRHLSLLTAKGTIFLPHVGVITVRIDFDDGESGGREHV